MCSFIFFFFKQKTAYEMRISDWSSDVCSSDLRERRLLVQTDRDDAAPVLRRYGRDAIKEVILGERMPEEYRARVIAVMQERYPDTPVRTARRSLGAYTITIE